MSASAGRVLLIPKGEFNSQTTYQPLDMVYYNGNSYVCKLTSTGNLPTNTTYFQIMTEGSGGHTILDGDGNTMPQRSKLRFVNFSVQDDSTNDATIVSDDSSVSVSHTGTASSSGVRKQQITVDGVATDVDGSSYMEQSINTSTSAAVTATFTNSAITANSAIDVYTSQQGLDYSTMTISAGSCTVTFPAQVSAASVTVRIYIRG